MSRLTEKLARVKAELAERERCVLIEILGGSDGVPEVLVVGGSAQAQRQALNGWYERHPELRRPAALGKGRQRAKAGSGSTRKQARP